MGQRLSLGVGNWDGWEAARHLSTDLHLDHVAILKRYRSLNISLRCLIFKTVIISAFAWLW